MTKDDSSFDINLLGRILEYAPGPVFVKQQRYQLGISQAGIFLFRHMKT
jgi:lipopolysaccharide/colanic/teichoic acid biosynthesis glycosyltransferase